MRAGRQLGRAGQGSGARRQSGTQNAAHLLRRRRSWCCPVQNMHACVLVPSTRSVDARRASPSPAHHSHLGRHAAVGKGGNLLVGGGGGWGWGGGRGGAGGGRAGGGGGAGRLQGGSARRWPAARAPNRPGSAVPHKQPCQPAVATCETNCRWCKQAASCSSCSTHLVRCEDFHRVCAEVLHPKAARMAQHAQPLQRQLALLRQRHGVAAGGAGGERQGARRGEEAGRQARQGARRGEER